MNKILWFSNTGEGLPIAYRMKKENKADIQVYIHSPHYKTAYNPIFKSVKLKDLKKAAFTSDLVIFDITYKNNNTKEDKILSRLFGVKGDDFSLFGKVADVISKHTKVFGNSEQTEIWEMDRWKGEQIAKQIGLSIPKSYNFSTLSAGISFLKKNKTHKWVFKPLSNMDLDLTYVEHFNGELIDKLMGDYGDRLSAKTNFILQEVISGVELSSEAWFDGNEFYLYNHTIEDKRMMNYDLGLSIGSQNNIVWVSKSNNDIMVKYFDKLKSIIKQTGYIGAVDINTIIDKRPPHNVYFLEFTPRLGYDAIYALLTLLKGSITEFFMIGKCSFENGYAGAERITIPPYPYSDNKLLGVFAQDVSLGKILSIKDFWAEDIYFNKGWKCAGADGIIGVMTAKGNSIGGAVGNTYRSINKLKISSYLQYRTDLGRRAEKAVKLFEKWGVRV